MESLFFYFLLSQDWLSLKVPHLCCFFLHFSPFFHMTPHLLFMLKKTRQLERFWSCALLWFWFWWNLA